MTDFEKQVADALLVQCPHAGSLNDDVFVCSNCRAERVARAMWAAVDAAKEDERPGYWQGAALTALRGQM